MVAITEVIWTNTFEEEVRKLKDSSFKEEEVRKLKDSSFKERIKKQIAKIVENPDIGKPLRFDLKSERIVYIKPYRLIYAVEGTKSYLLRVEHRKNRTVCSVNDQNRRLGH